ncbi:MAG: heme-copper oxidase subunit III [Chloroflexi bacterium]|nr:heme-copper oxidase subunit III [Chloroflexota bacterium]
MTTAVRKALPQGLDTGTMNRLGLWLFLVSDASFFLALISSRFFVVRLETPEDVSQILGLGLTILLLVSSLTAYRAEVAAEHGDQANFKRYIIATMLMGILFLGGVGFEWHEAYKHFPPSTGYGTILFTLTGVHATHVFSGVLLLGFIYFKGKNGAYGPDDYYPVEAAVKWWHFVDVAWVFIYPTLYLVQI